MSKLWSFLSTHLLLFLSSHFILLLVSFLFSPRPPSVPVISLSESSLLSLLVLTSPLHLSPLLFHLLVFFSLSSSLFSFHLISSIFSSCPLFAPSSILLLIYCPLLTPPLSFSSPFLSPFSPLLIFCIDSILSFSCLLSLRPWIVSPPLPCIILRPLSTIILIALNIAATCLKKRDPAFPRKVQLPLCQNERKKMKRPGAVMTWKLRGVNCFSLCQTFSLSIALLLFPEV